VKTHTREFGRDSIIYAEGEPPKSAFQIIRGNVELSINKGGRKVVIGTLGPKDFFGEMSLLQHRPREITVRTLSEVDVKIFDEDNFTDYLANEPGALLKYLNSVYERVRATSDRLRSEIGRNENELHTASHLEDATPSLKTAQTKAYGFNGADASAVASPTIEAPQTSVDLKLKVTIHPNSEETLRQELLQSQALEVFPFRIGRQADPALSAPQGASNEMNISDTPPYRVSRHHCAIEVVDGACFVRDCNSQLGTIVNGLTIGESARSMEARLKPGLNYLVLGDAESPYRFKVELSE